MIYNLCCTTQLQLQCCVKDITSHNCQFCKNIMIIFNKWLTDTWFWVCLSVTVLFAHLRHVKKTCWQRSMMQSYDKKWWVDRLWVKPDKCMCPKWAEQGIECKAWWAGKECSGWFRKTQMMNAKPLYFSYSMGYDKSKVIILFLQRHWVLLTINKPWV